MQIFLAVIIVLGLYIETFPVYIMIKTFVHNTALIWQKEASDKSEISRKRAKCVIYTDVNGISGCLILHIS